MGAFDDLERVVATLTEVTDRTPPTSPEAVMRWQNLGNALRARYLRTHRDEDLGRAIAAYERALALKPADSAADPRLLGNIGSAFHDRYDRHGNEADLDETERLYSEALRHAHPGSPDHVFARNNLARILLTRARTTGSPEALREAASAFREVVDLTPAGTPTRLIHEMNLAMARLELHRVTKDEEAGTAAAAGLRAIVATGLTVAPDAGLAAARVLGRWAGERDDWDEAADAYQGGMACLDSLYRRQGRRDQKEAWLGDAAGIASGAAYALARTGDVEAAVVATETGRAVILTETLVRTTTDLESLAQAGHADLAERFRRAVDALAAAEQPDQPGIGSRPAIGDLRAAVDTLVARIQALPGFEDFRRPPSIAAVTAAAGTTPLVYLVPADAGGVALVVREGRCSAVWLPDLTTATLSARAGAYFDAYANQRRDPAGWHAALLDLTAWSWPAILEPVVAALAGQSEVVLIPMGVLGMLPLHAAWRADASTPTGRRYALDDLVISYAPNARTLALARLAPVAGDGILAVADPLPVSADPLRYAPGEASAALDRFPRGLCLTGPQATRAAVLAEMVRWPVLHFACHGYADADQPADSAVLPAYDERVSLNDLFRSATFHPGLVVLSACESAVIGGEVPDEVVSLPSGFLQSGARGVVGSFWSVYDASTALLMHRFYQVWRGPGQPSPAAALRAAQQWLRDTPPDRVLDDPATRDAGLEAETGDGLLGREHPVHWAAFGHFGA
ncbi:CHAT domain-containing protein [Actinoplanes aureus]|uniref:CHAT domain-containing protein n=1 Tax=Actinoplanes aureus TaxID=2792083 RepID=A0A931C8N1_9ACTN|nr:CHAT domain-containing protein [Actinoplanes aureus]MBG0565479.1 CHAT domain-containing protein [Actinoplanes aureus]